MPRLKNKPTVNPFVKNTIVVWHEVHEYVGNSPVSVLTSFSAVLTWEFKSSNRIITSIRRHRPKEQGLIDIFMYGWIIV